MTHTATPWIRGQFPADILTADGKDTIAIVPTRLGEIYELSHGVAVEHEANAVFIVHACNVHDELVAALKAIAEIAWHRESAGTPPLSNESRWDVLKLAREAIAKAEGK